MSNFQAEALLPLVSAKNIYVICNINSQEFLLLHKTHVRVFEIISYAV